MSNNKTRSFPRLILYRYLLIAAVLSLNVQTASPNPTAPNLRSAATFILYTVTGAVGITGATHVTGDIGANVGAISGYGPTTVTGSMYNADGVTAQCSTDLIGAYNQLNATAPTAIHGPVLGNGETLYAGVYSIAGAGSIASTLTLDAQGNPFAVFIFKIGAAFTTGASTTINLVNGANACNVFWTAEGAISMAASTIMKGTLIANNGAISMAAGGSLEGRMFSTTGAASVDAASGSIPVCSSNQSWTGAENTNWANVNNWSYGQLPTSTTNITIPSSLTNYPILSSGSGSVQNITNESGASITITGATLQIAGSITNAGTFDVSTGTIELNGLTAQTIPAATFGGNTIQNLTINNIAGVTLGGALNLTDALTVSSGSMASNGMLTLKSSATQTARVATITTGWLVPVSGDVIVERYISSRRAFRFLTASVTSSGSIKANWMENANNATTSVNHNPVPGYGTHITGSAGGTNGFDATLTNNPSLFSFNNQSQGWVAESNTNSTLTAGTPYRILIRGDRGTNTNQADPASSATTLRTTGVLATGTFVMAKPGAGGTAFMPELSATPGAYNYIGNPYASSVDWLLLEKVNIHPTINIFDPTLSGTNGRGAYVSWSNIGTSNISSSVDNHIQSGQSIFAQTTGTNPSITFKETHKSTPHRVVFRPENNTPYLSLQLLLPGQEVSGGAADGFAVYFSEQYDSDVQDEDSYKFSNLDENIAIMRNGKLLSIEGRKPVTASDTIAIKMWQLNETNYFFKATINKFEDKVSSYLHDAFLGTTEKLKNNGVTILPFAITADPASFASNRFQIVFETYSTLPVTFSLVKAYSKGKGVQVEWIVESESNIEKYEVERSANGQEFIAKGRVAAIINPPNTSRYTWFDANPVEGDGYYRIKSFDKSGGFKYSQVVRIEKTNVVEPITVSISPAPANSFNLVFKNTLKGNYGLSLLNAAGQKVFEGRVQHSGGSATKTLILGNPLPAGIYSLTLIVQNQSQTILWLIP